MTIKIKRLRPSLREKKRYMLIDAHSAKYKEAFQKTFKELFGTWTLAKAGLQFLQKERGPIIRVEAKYVDHVRAALVCMNAQASCKQIGGTIKSLGGK